MGRGQVIDSDNLEALSAEHLTECQTADTTETVNSNFNRHKIFLHKNIFLFLSGMLVICDSTKGLFFSRMITQNCVFCFPLLIKLYI